MSSPPRIKRGGGAATVRIDGRKPSEFPELYTITRLNGENSAEWIDPLPGRKDWPWEVGAIMRVRSQAKLQVEDWTVTLDRFRSPSDFDFSVRGSVTGPDGSGSYSDDPFLSDSGRVVIDRSAWWLDRVQGVTIGEGFKITWSVLPHFVDTYKPENNPRPNLERATTLAQGLSNDKHILELVADDGRPLPITGIRVYRPLIGRSGSENGKKVKPTEKTLIFRGPITEYARDKTKVGASVLNLWIVFKGFNQWHDR